MQGSRYVSPEEVATYFGVTAETVRRMCRDKKIPGARKFGGQWRIPRSFLETDTDDVHKMAQDEDKE